MTILYESPSYNILNVYRRRDTRNRVDDFYNYEVILQRLPVSRYPETTSVPISNTSISPDSAINDWTTSALPLINAKLDIYDASFDGSASLPVDRSTFTQIFTE